MEEIKNDFDRYVQDFANKNKNLKNNLNSNIFLNQEE